MISPRLLFSVNVRMQTCYSEATETRPMSGGDDGARCFSLSYLSLLGSSSLLLTPPIDLAGSYVVNVTAIRVIGAARGLEGNVRKYARLERRY